MIAASMPVMKGSEMPARAAAGNEAATAGQNPGSPATTQFAAVLHGHSAAAREDSQRATGKRADARGLSDRQSGAEVGGTSGRPVIAMPMVPPVVPAPPPTTMATAQESASQTRIANDAELASAATGQLQRLQGLADGQPSMSADSSDTAPTPDASLPTAAPSQPLASGEAATEIGPASKLKGNGAAPQEVSSVALRNSSALSDIFGANLPANSGQTPPATDPSVTSLAGARRTTQPTAKGAEAGALSQSSAKLASAQHVALQTQPIAAAAMQHAGDDAHAPRGSKGDAHPAARGSDHAESDASPDAAATNVPPQAVVAANPADNATSPLNPTAMAPLQTPAAASLQSHGGASATQNGELTAANTNTSGIATVAQGAPLTAVGAARLLKTAAGSELRVGTQSADLGTVSIRTVLGREQMEAHISFSNERMGSALQTHFAAMSGSLEDRLGQSLGVRTSVTLSGGSDAGTGQGGRQEAARDGSSGQANGTGGDGGGNNAPHRDTSQEIASAAPYAASSSHGTVDATRSTPYASTGASRGRLDVRI